MRLSRLQRRSLANICEAVQVIVSAAIWGAAAGAVVGGRVADRIGRRGSLAIADFLFISGSLCMAAAPSVLILVVGRVLVGLGIGVASVTVPVYIAEVSPSNVRAQAVTANVLAITSTSPASPGSMSQLLLPKLHLC